MARNNVKPGSIITWTNAGTAVVAGDVVVVGNAALGMLGVALVDIANGASGEVALGEVWNLPKENSTAMAAGYTPSWDVSAGEFAAPGSEATGDVSGSAIVVTAAADTDTTAEILINPALGAVAA